MSWLAIVAPAWIAGSLLVLLSAPLGCLVLWRRMAFFSDALAHGALLGVAMAVWLHLPAELGIGIISFVVIALLFFLQDKRLPNDAILAVVASGMLCLGLLTLTQLTQQQANVLGFLFGNLLEVRFADLPKLLTIIGIGGMLLIKNWHAQICLATSPDLAHLQNINPKTAQLFFLGILAGFCTVALYAVGSLLISGLLILPALTARLIAKSPTQMALIAIIIGQLALTAGLWGSVWLDIPTGLGIVLLLVMGFLGGFVIHKALTHLN